MSLRSEILFLDGADSIKYYPNRQVLQASFVVIRHPVNRDLYEIYKSRYTKLPSRLVTAATVCKHLKTTLNHIF